MKQTVKPQSRKIVSVSVRLVGIAFASNRLPCDYDDNKKNNRIKKQIKKFTINKCDRPAKTFHIQCTRQTLTHR